MLRCAGRVPLLFRDLLLLGHRVLLLGLSALRLDLLTPVLRRRGQALAGMETGQGMATGVSLPQYLSVSLVPMDWVLLWGVLLETEPEGVSDRVILSGRTPTLFQAKLKARAKGRVTPPSNNLNLSLISLNPSDQSPSSLCSSSSSSRAGVPVPFP